MESRWKSINVENSLYGGKRPEKPLAIHDAIEVKINMKKIYRSWKEESAY